MSDEEQKDLNYHQEHKESKKSHFRLRFWVGFFVLIVIGTVVALAYKTGFTFSKMVIEIGNGGGILSEIGAMPAKDPDRTNILLLGIRGEGDPNGGLLTDAIMMVSLKNNTGEVAMISIPRDLYVNVPGTDKKDKINAIYAYGEQKRYGSGGIIYTKQAVSRVVNLYIDYVVVANFQAFQEIVDILGGITVYLDKPFKEETQFAQEIIIDLPAGENFLDGRTALYFVRSRYSTSDFDRARRQQQVLLAIKEKIFSLGVLSNPIKLFNILDSLGRNVRTDMKKEEMIKFLGMKNDFGTKHIKRRVFDTSPEGLLYSSRLEDGTFVLLPVGDNFEKIQEACKNIFD